MSYTYLEWEKHKSQKMVTIPYLMLVLTVSFVMVVSHTCIFSFSPSLKLLMRVASRPSLLLPSIPVKSYFRNFSPLFHLPLICLGGFCWNNTNLVKYQWFEVLPEFFGGIFQNLLRSRRFWYFPKSWRFIASLIFTAPTNFPRHASVLYHGKS